MYCSLKGRGLAAGIPHFNLDRLTSNTMASHRLIQHVGRRYGLHVSEALYDRLNVYYFVEGHPLNDRPLLAKVAAENIAETLNKTGNNDVPLAEHEILTFLNGKEGRREIENAIKALKELGVHGIPKFIVEGSSVVDGAADSSTFHGAVLKCNMSRKCRLTLTNSKSITNTGRPPNTKC
eukprot:scaffold11526_cov69-Cyclotella_meneghiniana.AAC.2